MYQEVTTLMILPTTVSHVLLSHSLGHIIRFSYGIRVLSNLSENPLSGTFPVPIKYN